MSNTTLSWEALPPQLASALRALNVVAPDGALWGDVVINHQFAGQYGPASEVLLVHAVVPPTTDLTLTTQALRALYPTRWRVFHDDGDLPMALTVQNVRLQVQHGLPAFSGTPSALAHLRAGELRPLPGADPTAIEATTQELLALYPFLAAPHLGRTAAALPHVDEVHADIRRREVGGRRRVRVISPAEQPWVDLLVRWHQQASHESQLVPAPGFAELPDADPWTARDPAFREWVIEQTTGGRRVPADNFLAAALAAQRSGGQKPTHQGWEVVRHAITALLCLDTSRIAASDRRAIRVATLLHDIGKLHNVWTPGAHAKIGGRIWLDLRPEWLTDAEAELVTFLIENHDALGLLDRGIRDREYRGGLSPADMREQMSRSGRAFGETLDLLSTIYSADVAAVPTLRWLLPLTPLLEGLVRAGGPPMSTAPIIVVMGAPGSGKSTHAAALALGLGPDVLVASVSALIQRVPEVRRVLTAQECADVDALRATAQQRAKNGGLGPARYDEIVCALLARTIGRPIVLDAFPRSRAVAEQFLAVPGVAERTVVIVLTLAGDETEQSARRQFVRESAIHGTEIALAQRPMYRRRAEFYRDESRLVAHRLEAAGIRVVHVTTTDDFPDARREVLAFLESAGVTS